MASSLGNSIEHLGQQIVELADEGLDRSEVDGRIEQRLGVDVGDVLDAHVGLDLGGGLRVACGGV